MGESFREDMYKIRILLVYHCFDHLKKFQAYEKSLEISENSISVSSHHLI